MFSKIFLGEDSAPSVDPNRDEVPGYIVHNQCFGCRWFDAATGTSCVSFPKGIPTPILLGEFDHRVPYDPDNDEELLFEKSNI